VRRGCGHKIAEKDDPCGKPSVDFVVGASGNTYWLCAEHFDEWQAVKDWWAEHPCGYCRGYL